jgi:alpha-glucosidase (family GH31 glycosyl hydrolase)
VYPSWESLAFQPHFTASAANVGFGYWSHDIGGFMLPTEGELYTRWIQLGVLSPVFRTHGSRDPRNIKRMWFYDQRVSDTYPFDLAVCSIVRLFVWPCCRC